MRTPKSHCTKPVRQMIWLMTRRIIITAMDSLAKPARDCAGVRIPVKTRNAAAPMKITGGVSILEYRTAIIPAIKQVTSI